MKLLWFTFRLFLLLTALAVAWFVVSAALRDKRWRDHPDLAFQELTDTSLPEGVRATVYTSEMDDALFRSTRYWMLAGPREKLLVVPERHRLIKTSGFFPDEAAGFQRQCGIMDSKAKVTERFASPDDGTLPMAYFYVLDDGTAFYVQW